MNDKDHCRSNDLKVFWTSGNQKSLAVDVRRQQIIQQLLFIWKCRIDGTLMKIRQQSIALKSWRIDLQDTLNKPAIQQDMLSKLTNEIQKLVMELSLLFASVRNNCIHLCHSNDSYRLCCTDNHNERTRSRLSVFFQHLDVVIVLGTESIENIENTFTVCRLENKNDSYELRKYLQALIISRRLQNHRRTDSGATYIPNCLNQKNLQSLLIDGMHEFPVVYNTCKIKVNTICISCHMNCKKVAKWNQQFHEVVESREDVLGLTRILYEEGVKMLSVYEIQTMDYFGSKRTKLHRLESPETLSETQWPLMVPSQGNLTFEVFHMILSYSLLRSISLSFTMEFVSSGEIWTRDHSIGTDLLRLKNFRNKYAADIPYPALSNADFKTIWAILEILLYRPSFILLNEFLHEMQQKITELRTYSYNCHAEIIHHLARVIWYNSESGQTEENLESYVGHLQALNEKAQDLPQCIVPDISYVKTQPGYMGEELYQAQQKTARVSSLEEVRLRMGKPMTGSTGRRYPDYDKKKQNHWLQCIAKVLSEHQSARDKLTDEQQFNIHFERERTGGNVSLANEIYVMTSQGEIILNNHEWVHIMEDNDKELRYHHSLQQKLGQHILSTASLQHEYPSAVVQRIVSRPDLGEKSFNKSNKIHFKEIIKLLQENADELKQDPDQHLELLLWDIDGYQVFYTKHQIFWTNQDIIGMVSDVTGQLDAYCLECEGIMKCRVCEMIEGRLKSKHYFSQSTKSGIPPGILAEIEMDQISQKQPNEIDSATRTTTSEVFTMLTTPTPADLVAKEHHKASNILGSVLKIYKLRTKLLLEVEPSPVSSTTGNCEIHIPKCMCIQRKLSLTCKQRHLEDTINMAEYHKCLRPSKHKGNEILYFRGPAVISENDKTSHSMKSHCSEDEEVHFQKCVSSSKNLSSESVKDPNLSATDSQRFLSVPAQAKGDLFRYVSLCCEKKITSLTVQDMNVVEMDTVDVSLTCNQRNLEDAIKFKDSVCTSVTTFFKKCRRTFGKQEDETKQQIGYVADNLAPNEMRRTEIPENNVREIDLKKNKKYVLHRIIYPELNRLPQPSLSRYAIVGFFEGQPHAELREILKQLASDKILEPHITMKYDMLRLCTMKTFPGRDRPFATKITGAGFYYAGHQDQVICYCCGSRKDNWIVGDIPLLIHQNMAPNCCFLTDNAAVNVPVRMVNSTTSSAADVRLRDILISGGSNHSDTAHVGSSLLISSSEQSRFKISSGTHQMLVTNKTTAPNHPTLSMGQNVLDNQQTPFAYANSVEVPPPKYPQYAVKDVRISSFQGWSEELQQKPEEMSECGFYYAGFSDCVRCFYCGVGLRHWMNEDDPWIEHARWSTSCVYVLKMKGEEFVSLVKMAVEIAEREEKARNNGGANQPAPNNTETAPVNTLKEDFHGNNSTISITARDSGCSMVATGSAVGEAAASTPSYGNAEIQKYLLTDAAQSVLEMGYQPKMVLQAIEKALMKKGIEELTGQIIMETLFEIEEQDKPKGQLKPSHQSTQENKSSPKDGEEAICGTVEGLQIDPEKIRKEHRELREVTLCKICLDNTSSVVFLPCGHLVTCPDCAPAMRKCPICRTLIKGTVKTFFG